MSFYMVHKIEVDVYLRAAVLFYVCFLRAEFGRFNFVTADFCHFTQTKQNDSGFGPFLLCFHALLSTYTDRVIKGVFYIV